MKASINSNKSEAFKLWKLRHQMIVAQIKERGDFDLEEINKKLAAFTSGDISEEGICTETY